MNETKEMVMFNSAEAAQYKTGLAGWVSRDGFFWGENERAARYQGCTHRNCEDCGQPVNKSWLVCKECREKKDRAKFEAKPKEVWNEEGCIFSEVIDRYFWSWDEVEDYCGDEGIDEKDLRLVICVPQFPRQLTEDYFEDELAEDGDLPASIIKAMEDFNKVVKDAGPLSWYPGNKAAIRKG